MSVLTPLSNDPMVLQEYTETLGVSPSTFEFAEVFSLDPEMLAFLPPNPISLIFLFPVGSPDGILERRHRDDGKPEGKLPFFMKQTLGNACGTIAVIHSIINHLDVFDVKEDSWLGKFIKDTKDMTPEQRGQLLEEDDTVQTIHETTATEDDTPIRPEDDENHFIAFTPVDGILWELDGRKPFPICHGKCQNLISQVAEIIQTEFYPNVKNPMETSMVLLCASN